MEAMVEASLTGDMRRIWKVRNFKTVFRGKEDDKSMQGEREIRESEVVKPSRVILHQKCHF
jgi:hypothetical protein